MCLKPIDMFRDERRIYQTGRALLAKRDIKGARSAFEHGVAQGYNAARIDLANLLVDNAAGMLNPKRAMSLYEQAWNGGVAIAAFRLGQIYEHGVRRTDADASTVLSPDEGKSWLWYQKGAAAGEPNALGRFAQRMDERALQKAPPGKTDGDLLQAFKLYAMAAENAKNADWPDNAWKHWRYRRSTLARFLAREGMMQQVADAYASVVRDESSPRTRTFWDTLSEYTH